MRFQGTLALCYLASTSAAVAISKRATPILASDVLAIDAAVKVLTGDVTAYNGGNLITTLVEGGPVLYDVGTIHVVNRKGYADALVSPKLSQSDSTVVIETVANTVAIDIPQSVKVLKSKKPQFQASGLDLTVLASLKLLKYDHDTLSAAILVKLTANATETARGEAGVAAIDNALQDGINYFSS